MNLNIECNVSNYSYVEVSCYLIDRDIKFSTEILNTLSNRELEIYNWINNEVDGLPLTEFFIHSSDKSFEGIINFINGLNFIDFIYILYGEGIKREDINISNEFLNPEDIPHIISIMTKTHEFIISTTSDSDYSEKLYTLYDGLKKLPPLEYCQEIMGKRFARVSDYKKFFFVPVKYRSSSKACRVFNSTELLQLVPLKEKKQLLTDDELYNSLKVLADKTRLEIINHIKHKSYYGKELSEKLDIKPPTISHHIEQLNKIGLIHLEQIGNTKYFSLNRVRFKELITSLELFL